MGIQFVGMPEINVRAGNSVEASMSVLRFMTRAFLQRQKLLKVALF